MGGFIIHYERQKKFDTLTRWYGEDMLRQYESIIVITNQHVFYKTPDTINTSMFNDMNHPGRYMKDLMILDINPVKSVLIHSHVGAGDLTLGYESGSVMIHVPGYAIWEITRILRKLKPDIPIQQTSH